MAGRGSHSHSAGVPVAAASPVEAGRGDEYFPDSRAEATFDIWLADWLIAKHVHVIGGDGQAKGGERGSGVRPTTQKGGGEHQPGGRDKPHRGGRTTSPANPKINKTRAEVATPKPSGSMAI